MNEILAYYLALPYKIEVTQIPGNEGGGFRACFPEIGRFAIIGDGETPQEAIKNLRSQQEIAFDDYLSCGAPIPRPGGTNI